jgi:hypothetical protein
MACEYHFSDRFLFDGNMVHFVRLIKGSGVATPRESEVKLIHGRQQIFHGDNAPSQRGKIYPTAMTNGMFL